MSTIVLWVTVDGERVAEALQEARTRLDGAQGEMVLDFSSVQRIDAGALRALEELVDSTRDKGTQLILSNVNIDIYKVLKLVELAPRLSFRTRPLQAAHEACTA